MKCQYLVAVTHSISDRNVLSGRDLVTRDGTKLQNISYVGGEGGGEGGEGETYAGHM